MCANALSMAVHVPAGQVNDILCLNDVVRRRTQLALAPHFLMAMLSRGSIFIRCTA